MRSNIRKVFGRLNIGPRPRIRRAARMFRFFRVGRDSENLYERKGRCFKRVVAACCRNTVTAKYCCHGLGEGNSKTDDIEQSDFNIAHTDAMS